MSVAAVQSERNYKMMRNLKTLGPALLAAFALSAVVASAASAETAHFTVEGIGAGETAGFQGEQIGTNTLTINGLTFTCKKATATGEALSKGPEPSTIVMQSVSEECHVVIAGLTKTATVTTNGCTGIGRATKNTGGVAFSLDGTLECPEKKQVEVHIYSTASGEATTICTYDGTAHQATTGVTELTNEAAASPDYILGHTNISFPVDNTIKSAVCGQNAVETVTAQGTFKIQGLKSGVPVHTTIS